MKVLIAYMSKTGNTRKVAEAIYSEISCEKELRRIEDVVGIDGYDIAFLGFPVHQFGPDKKTKETLQRLCSDGRKVAMFVTHASPEDFPELHEWLEKFKAAASGADLVGMFNCQGELAAGVKFVMKIAPMKKLRDMAKIDNSRGQPDAGRLERAREFAHDIMARMSSQSGGLQGDELATPEIAA